MIFFKNIYDNIFLYSECQQESNQHSSHEMPGGEKNMDNNINYGTVKWFNSEKGYGFIVDQNGNDIFVHFSVIETDGYKYLKDGQTVSYELIKTDKGLQAINVKSVEENNIVKS